MALSQSIKIFLLSPIGLLFSFLATHLRFETDPPIPGKEPKKCMFWMLCSAFCNDEAVDDDDDDGDGGGVDA